MRKQYIETVFDHAGFGADKAEFDEQAGGRGENRNRSIK